MSTRSVGGKRSFDIQTKSRHYKQLHKQHHTIENTSAIDLVKSLKFDMVKKFKQEEREGIIQLWTEFERNQPELTSRNVSMPSQRDLVNTLVKINGKQKKKS